MKDIVSILWDQKYDFLEGVDRSHQVGQLWVKPNLSPPRYYGQLDHEFVSDNLNAPVPVAKPIGTLQGISGTKTTDKKFSLGVSVLEVALKGMNIGTAGLGTALSFAKTLSMSFDEITGSGVSEGEVDRFLHNADLRTPNPSFLKQLNLDNVLLIMRSLKSSKVSIHVTYATKIDADLKAQALSETIGTKVDAKVVGNSEITFSFPTHPTVFAIQAVRLRFRNGDFRGVDSLNLPKFD
jgi:hypothetical protein